MTSAFAPSLSYGGPSNGINPNRGAARPAQPPPVDISALQSASRVLQDQFAKDATIIPDLGDTLTSPSGQVSASYSVFPDDYRVPFQKRKFVGIPEGLFEYFEAVNGVTHMGLMPEIERAWISYDHKLFFWDYVDGHEISSFMEQSDVISDVALVKPKQGLFIDEISSLFVITTPLSVFILGVSFSSGPGRGRAFRDLKLYATDLKVNTDVEMVSVIGTPDGRIFMCGAQDGCLYELHYQENESWFGKRVQLINHSVGGVQSLLPRFAASTAEDKISLLVADDARNCFYALSTKGISIYKSNGEKSVQHVQTVSNIFKAAQEKAPGHPALTPQNFEIRSLHVVEPVESRAGVQFFAMTNSGVRLYFGPTTIPSYSYGLSASYGHAARPVQLIHVRLPPTNLIHPDVQIQQYRPPVTTYGAAQVPTQVSSRPFPITEIENTNYYRGLTVAAHPGDRDGNDYILCMSPDLTRIGTLGQLNLPQQQPSTTTTHEPYRSTLTDGRPTLTEHATLLCIPGRTWATAKLPPATTASAAPDGPPPVAPINELATQFGETPCQFMLLTNSGLSYLVKRRAVDFLRAILEEIQAEGNVQRIVEFRDSFGRDQTCCMLLALACGNTFLDFPDDATSNTGTITTPRPDTSSVAKQAFYDLGERPTWTERVTYGTTDSQGTAIFSGRREGLCLYFARLVRPIWKTKLTKPGMLNKQKLAVEEDVIVTIQKNLFFLKDFLDRNPHLFHSSPSESSTRVPAAEQEAWRAEQNSVSELLALLSRTIEALSFILLLNDYMLGDLISQCDPEIQRLIAAQTFESLISTQDGMTISRALVNVVIDQQIGQQISVDTISEVLQHRCGSFCSTDDVMLYKAKENVRKAVESRNPAERQNWLAESLRLFIKGARILEFDKLREICGDYQQLNYAKGAVELPLTCAQVLDPENRGLEAWHAGMPQGDPRTELAEKRLRCYELVLDSLAVFEEKCNTAKAPTNGHLPASADAEAVRSHAYELAFGSDDEFFHSTLYDWLIGRGLADDLLEMRPAFLEAHLRREPITVQKFQLLWQFYVKNGQPLRAAEVLGALAESTQFDLELGMRLEYLTLAVANAKSHPISANGRHETAIAFLTDLEEKLDVAQVQLEVYNVLAPHINDAPEVGERIKLLSKQLLTMTDIFQRYAVAFDLPDMKLLCLHVSEHRDESVVRPIWNQIFDEILREEPDPSKAADRIFVRVVSLGKRFYPSESAFPLRYIATLLVRFALANKNVVPRGWAPRILVQCGVPFQDVWDVLHEMYESQVPPFNDQANVQAISSDIAVLLSDWLNEAKRPQALAGRGEFPVGRIDRAVDQYLAELEPGREETKAIYESIKRELRRNW
ncbi:putative non-repetitive/WGA-negative nucleoporin C-terminal [Lyophyllum shimeji]|uniref:Non-repetitive/WGA-negative nucleoporin C-terminal n=1 Tax=Lyophyllum shimeji TaxID=47721 RepID=A0A9P3PIJ6_LYOSH|nr:putative non-repetitive/WGA-negative nucleoporin C-terminal [Lyophyllum shimeji]